MGSDRIEFVGLSNMGRPMATSLVAAANNAGITPPKP